MHILLKSRGQPPEPMHGVSLCFQLLGESPTATRLSTQQDHPLRAQKQIAGPRLQAKSIEPKCQEDILSLKLQSQKAALSQTASQPARFPHPLQLLPQAVTWQRQAALHSSHCSSRATACVPSLALSACSSISWLQRQVQTQRPRMAVHRGSIRGSGRSCSECSASCQTTEWRPASLLPQPVSCREP